MPVRMPHRVSRSGRNRPNALTERQLLKVCNGSETGPSLRQRRNSRSQRFRHRLNLALPPSHGRWRGCNT
jgi:hypothetical protein